MAGGNTSKTLEDLFVHTLKDIYYAEKQLLKSLPKMAKAAHSSDLKSAFEHHREQTEEHVSRLEQVFQTLGRKAEGVPCEAIQGILEEGKEVMEDFGGSAAIDAGLIAGGQAAEHYEIARYGALKTWAAQLGHKPVVQLLEQTLGEEKETDALLSSLADKLNLEGGRATVEPAPAASPAKKPAAKATSGKATSAKATTAAAGAAPPSKPAATKPAKKATGKASAEA